MSIHQSTSIPEVLTHIDRFEYWIDYTTQYDSTYQKKTDNNLITTPWYAIHVHLTGWAFNTMEGETLSHPLSSRISKLSRGLEGAACPSNIQLSLQYATIDGSFGECNSIMTPIQRSDVSKFYQSRYPSLATTIQWCGWDETIIVGYVQANTQFTTSIRICMNTQNNAVILHHFPVSISAKSSSDILSDSLITSFSPEINRGPPSYVVIDNVYTNPNQVREFALTQSFEEHKQQHKGQRTEQVFRFPGLKSRFEIAIGSKITNWHKYGTNGCFQFCTAEDALVYHTDGQQWAGVLFLTPDAPVGCGTTIFRHPIQKKNNKMIVTPEQHSGVFAKGFFDATPFEKVDVVGNVYNRVLLFNAKMVHAASQYFGTNKSDSRLFQMFFFDLEDNPI